MKHPNPDVPEMHVAWRARELANELRLADKHVFFNEGWVDYGDRHNYLLDADVGVSTHFEHVETTFSFRTRILDYLWAGRPVVATGGDTFGRLIASEGLGETVTERDVDGLVAALGRSLYDDAFAEQCRVNVARLRPEFTWRRTMAPLVDFCEHPARAPDVTEDVRRLVRRPVVPASVLGREAMRASTLLRQGGPRLLGARMASRTRRLLRERRDGRGAD
jgi:hypothetical protein